MNLNIKTVTKNQKREVVVIRSEDTKKHMYAWIEGEKLTIVDLPFDEQEEKLFLTKKELMELFPKLTIESHVAFENNYFTGHMQTVPVKNGGIIN